VQSTSSPKICIFLLVMITKYEQLEMLLDTASTSPVKGILLLGLSAAALNSATHVVKVGTGKACFAGKNPTAHMGYQM
jgi:hypothetical protein